jgi:DNA-binding IclR family transcriptional regulator
VVLELFIAREEGREVTLSSICRVTSLPEGVVLRSLATLIETGMILRQPRADGTHAVSLLLSQSAFERLCDYFSRTR